MATKDYFSDQSKAYATFRPTYPKELYDFIFSHLENKNTAWDCATGNGQVAQFLCQHFDKVYATDLSEQQIKHAYPSENIIYSVQKAEQTDFPDATFDLITVGQALHWIDTNLFYQEAMRTAKKNALLAVWGYALLSVSEEIDKIFLDFYHNTVGPYWDSARKLVEQEYRTIPFPFTPIETPKFELIVQWSSEQFAGYLSSWSATQKYRKETNADPLPAVMEKISSVWKASEIKTVSFPLFLKLGHIH
jgi:ubiquinone/menaquinone biosynthesis C-methylase UbiE